MKALEVIVAGLITVAVFITGCDPSYQQYDTLKNKREQKQIVTRQKVFNFSDISPISRDIDNRETDVDELIQISQDYIDYVQFRRNYPDYENKIIGKLKENRFNEVDNLVRELAGKLERDDNPYAKLYLEKVKNFTYTIHEYYTAAIGRKTEVVDTEWNEAIADGLEMCLAPLRFAFTQDLGRYNFIEESDVKKQFFDEILVHPYSGTTRKIRTEVPLEGSQLQTDLETIKRQKAIEEARREELRKVNRTVDEIKDIVRKYENRFRSIKNKTNPDMWDNSIANSYTKASVWVDDLKICDEIAKLYNNLSNEGQHYLYEPLKRKIREFTYRNIAVQVEADFWGLISQKRYVYDKEVTEFYLVNPFSRKKWTLSGYGRFIGIHPGHLTRTRTNLQDFFENNKPR